MRYGLCIILALLMPLAMTAEWELVWSDEFDYEGLPDAKKWNYELGFIRNKELQYYTEARKENAWVADGHLTITGRKERFKNPQFQSGAEHWKQQREYAEYTAASITTRFKHAWTYGRFEIKAKLPQGKGIWPALWTLGTNIGEIGWPKCGEIDIMEFVGKKPDLVHGTVHFSQEKKHKMNGGKLQVLRPFDDFHVYAIEWFPDRIDFYFNEQKYHSFSTADAKRDDMNPFHKPHYLLMNLAIGGSWGGPVDDSVLPQAYKIDYVRVYQQKSND